MIDFERRKNGVVGEAVVPQSRSINSLQKGLNENGPLKTKGLFERRSNLLPRYLNSNRSRITARFPAIAGARLCQTGLSAPRGDASISKP